MLRIRVSELSQADRDRLRTELAAVLLAESTYLPFLDHRSGELRMRPPSIADRARADAFAEAMKLDELDDIEISSSALANALTTLIRRYQTATLPENPTMPERLTAPRMATQIQRRLIAYVLDGAQNGFGLSAPGGSWSSTHSAVPSSQPWEAIATGSAVLANALAELRGETASVTPQQMIPSIADSATERLPAVARIELPDPLPEPEPYQATAPLPRAVDLPRDPENRREDQAIFTQLRQQLLGAMMTAAQSYGVTSPPSDPAGLLDALRRIDVVDEVDLRLAEGILALCGRVVSDGRASIDDFRQAMTLYLLFHRGRLGKY